MRRAVLAVLFCAMALWGCSPVPSTPQTTPPASLDSQQSVTPMPSPAAPFRLVRITPQQVRARVANGESIVLADVRGRGSYTLMHIAGAVSLPGADYQVWGPTLSREQTIVLYCA